MNPLAGTDFNSVLIEYVVVKTDESGEFYLRVMIEKVYHHSDHGPFATLKECEEYRDLMMGIIREMGGIDPPQTGSGTLQ